MAQGLDSYSYEFQQINRARFSRLTPLAQERIDSGHAALEKHSLVCELGSWASALLGPDLQSREAEFVTIEPIGDESCRATASIVKKSNLSSAAPSCLSSCMVRCCVSPTSCRALRPDAVKGRISLGPRASGRPTNSPRAGASLPQLMRAGGWQSPDAGLPICLSPTSRKVRSRSGRAREPCRDRHHAAQSSFLAVRLVVQCRHYQPPLAPGCRATCVNRQKSNLENPLASRSPRILARAR